MNFPKEKKTPETKFTFFKGSLAGKKNSLTSCLPSYVYKC